PLKPHSPAKPLLPGLQNFAIRATGFNCFTFGCQIPNLQSKGCWIESDREVIMYLKRPFDAGIGPDWLISSAFTARSQMSGDFSTTLTHRNLNSWPQGVSKRRPSSTKNNGKTLRKV